MDQAPITTYRSCSVWLVFTGLLMELMLLLISGELDIDPIYWVLTILLICWLWSGSNLARSLVVFLTASGVLIFVAASIPAAIEVIKNGGLLQQELAFVYGYLIWLIVTGIHGFVAWRLFNSPKVQKRESPSPVLDSDAKIKKAANQGWLK